MTKETSDKPKSLTNVVQGTQPRDACFRTPEISDVSFVLILR